MRRGFPGLSCWIAVLHWRKASPANGCRSAWWRPISSAAGCINFDRYADVERILSRTLQSLPADFDDPIKHVVSCKLATALAAQGKIEESQRLFDQAIDASRDDAAILADCLYYRAQLARNSSDAAGALELSKQALRYFDAAGRVEPKARAVMRAEWALALSANGQPAAADREFAGAMRELELAGRGSSTEAATMHNNWGLVLSSSGQPRAALSHYDRAVAIARTLAPDAEPSSTQVANQARILSTLGRYRRRARSTKWSSRRRARHSYVEDQVSALLGLARIAFLTDDLQGSQRLIDEASAARSPEGGVLEGGVADTDLEITQARLWQRMGRNDEARAVFTKMLDQLAASGSRGSLAASLLVFRGQTFAAQNRSAEALADAKQALPDRTRRTRRSAVFVLDRSGLAGACEVSTSGRAACRGASVGGQCARESRGYAGRRSPVDQGRARARRGAREISYRKLADSRANHAGPLKPICTDS